MLSFAVHVAFGKTEIDDVNVVTCGVVSSNKEVIWLNITMNDSFFVYFLNTVDELFGNHENGLEIELALACLE